MRSFIGCVVFIAVVSWTPRPAQTFAAIDPAVEQLSYTSAFIRQCAGCGVDASALPPMFDVAPILIDADDSTRVIPLPFSRGPVAWSPDGRAMLTVLDGEIYVSPATGAPLVNLTNLPEFGDGAPAWSPDGTRIAFQSNRDGAYGVYVMNADGSGVVRLHTQAAGDLTWSPDSTRLAFACASESSSPSHICTIAADGSGFARVTSGESSDGEPDWSPNGQTIVFSTTRYGGQDLALMNPDGSNVRRVTQGNVLAHSPDWSSDGTRIAFVDSATVDYEWWTSVALINADGTGLTYIGLGDSPAWRPWAGGLNDRPRASFTYQCVEGTCTLDASSSSDSDGSITNYAWMIEGVRAAGVTVSHTFVPGYLYNVQLVVMDDDGALATATQIVDLNQPPVVSFVWSCAGLTCAFDASATSDPDNALVMFVWHFGDDVRNGTAMMTHTYGAAGTYTVTLTASDTVGGSASYSQTITVVRVTEPLASFTSSCIERTCSFDASGSSDPNGDIVSYAWYFGDGAEGAGITVSHTYTAIGTISVRLTVTDASGSSSVLWQNVTVKLPEPVHVGDLDGASSGSQSWTATTTATIHDSGHAPVANAAVIGYWTDGTLASCRTGPDGRCSVASSRLLRKTTSVRLSITNVTRPGFAFNPAANHDPDSDSTGGSITIIKP